jgi:four helix bundle protein
MATITRFEDIEAWQMARVMMREVERLTTEGRFGFRFRLKDQFYGAALSIMSNIAEGFGRRTDREFNQFLGIAHGSVSEFKSLLYVSLDAGCITTEEFDKLYTAADTIGRKVYGFANYLRDR